MRECIVWQEEAIRQHGFCRKFTKDDYLHNLLRYYHDMYEFEMNAFDNSVNLKSINFHSKSALDKFMQLENQISSELNDELMDLLPINCKIYSPYNSLSTNIST